jgi:hypothetical protein
MTMHNTGLLFGFERVFRDLVHNVLILNYGGKGIKKEARFKILLLF